MISMPKKPPLLKSQSRARYISPVPTSSAQAAPTSLKSFPRALAASLRPTPVPLTRLIGREQEVQKVSDLLRDPQVRLVTLTGTAGIGKTRLAWQLITELQEGFSAGCYFVSLADVHSGDLIIPAIIHTLGLPRAENRSAFKHLVAFLQQQQTLLVLDNFEQLASSAPLLLDLLSACAGLKLLVTSRAVLKVRGEYEFSVPSLPLPDPAALPNWEHVRDYPAIALFLERAQAAKHSFHLSKPTASTIVGICARLDGLPLAIELAAARIKLLSPTTLLRRLEQHTLQVLTGGGPDLPARQQTLRATIAWSYDLLASEAQWLFRHLAVFVGGCTLEAIEAFCALRGKVSAPVLDVVTSLLDQNLLAQREEQDQEPRFYLFEILREFARECLVEEEELEPARQAHAAYYASLVEAVEPSLFGFPPGDWLDQIEEDYANVRAALECLLEQHQSEAAVRCAGTLGNFWFFRGHLSEGRSFLARALAASNVPLTPASSAVRANALYMAAWLALWQLDFPEAKRSITEGLHLFEALDDARGRAAVLNLLSMVEETLGERAIAQEMSERAVKLCQEHGEQRGLADIFLMQGMQALFRGDFDLTQHYCTESLALFQQLGDPWGIATNLHYLGWASYCQGDMQVARQRSEEGVARFRSFGIPSLLAEALTILGFEATHQGEAPLAAGLFDEALILGRAVGNPLTIARVFCGLGHLALRQEQVAHAQDLFEESLRCLKGIEHFARANWIIASCLEGVGEIAWSQEQAIWAARLLGA
jgi:predicted ATPase